MDNTPQTESIKKLIDSIKNKNVVLPEFQRDFVWDIGKTYDLFDSLVKDIFIGSIIYGIPSFEITVRELDDRPRKGNGSRRRLKTLSYTTDQIDKQVKIGNFRIILDGQQRITSLYRALKGIDSIWFITKKENERKKENKKEEIEFHQNTLEDLLFEFEGNESKDRLSIKLSDVYELMENQYFEDEIYDLFFKNLKYIENKDDTDKKQIFREYLILSKKLQDLLKADKLLSFYLLNTNSEKFALFFERSNSRGIQLNFIDILAAKLYKGFNLREKIEEFEEKFPNYYLNREIAVRTIAYIVNKGKDIDRSSILSKLKHTHFAEYWDNICELYKKSIDFLFENNYIISQSWMPYENMLIPLIIFLREIGEDFSQMEEKQSRFIRFWYWASIFSQRYTGSSNEIIIQDSRILETIAQNKKITDRNYFFRLRKQINSYEELLSFSKKGSVIYSGILNLLNFNAKGLIDWKNTNRLSFNSKLEDHHIFPKEYIRSHLDHSEDALELIDCVINRTLIPKLTNIQIGKKSPSEYLKILEKENPNLKVSLNKHLIPVEIIEGLYDEYYDEFLKERAENIFNILEHEVSTEENKIIEEFYKEPTALTSGEIIEIFADYYGQRINAEFDITNRKVIFSGKSYSVSGAGNAAKKQITGLDMSTNGWEFWKFYDEQNQEKYIEELRS